MLMIPLTPGSSIPKRRLLPAPIRPLVSAEDLSQEEFAPSNGPYRQPSPLQSTISPREGKSFHSEK